MHPHISSALAAILASSAAAQQLVAYDNRPAFVAATGQLTPVDFESLPSGTQVTTQLAPFGIAMVTGNSQFAPGTTTQWVTDSASLPFGMFAPGTLPSEPNFLSNDLTPPVYATGEITFQFVVLRTAVGAFVADRGPLDRFEIELFLGTTSLGSITVPQRMLPNSFVGVVSSQPFTEARFRSQSSVDSWGLDNLEHGDCASASAVAVADSGGRNAPNSIAAGSLPQLGNSGFTISLASPGNPCGLTGSALVALAVSGGTGSTVLAGFGCGAGNAGEVMLGLASPPTLLPLRPWAGVPAVFAIPIPPRVALCGLGVHAQGLWFDPQSVSAPVVLSWRLDLVLGL